MSASVRFDEDGARQVLTDAPDGSTLQAIRDASHASGLDPVASLYNEALSLAEEGHLGQARTRLHVLLGLAPSDGGSHLLLAKVYARGQQWRRALAALDDAAQCGAPVPAELRAAVVRHLNADEAHEATRVNHEAQSDGELRKLKSEARRLRSENAHLITRTRQLEEETRRWALVATVTSLISICFMLYRMLFGAPATLVEEREPVPELLEVAEEAAPEGLAPVRDVDTAQLATATLENTTELAGSALSVVVRGGHAELSGTSMTYAQIRTARTALLAIEGIEEVGHDNVRVRARAEGASHTVVSGDTLSRVAWDYYGDETKYDAILEANSNLGGKTSLKLGQVLVIPAIE
jgi:phage tail protein X